MAHCIIIFLIIALLRPVSFTSGLFQEGYQLPNCASDVVHITIIYVNLKRWKFFIYVPWFLYPCHLSSNGHMNGVLHTNDEK